MSSLTTRPIVYNSQEAEALHRQGVRLMEVTGLDSDGREYIRMEASDHIPRFLEYAFNIPYQPVDA